MPPKEKLHDVDLTVHNPALWASPEYQIQKKFDAMGGQGFFGDLATKQDGQLWTFVNGSCICYNEQMHAAYEIHGAIYAKWLSLGGLGFDLPTTDETSTPDGVGRYSHFNHASIY